MAEVVLGSPGVTTRELDLSAPGVVRPQGIPAGVIGTSQKGPAFVPVNFATVNDFFNLFGATEGKHFGAMAVNEWMRNSRSGVFIRTLGIGDGKKRNTSTLVTTNAGFRVGSSMRDKDRNSGSSYAASETDGSADGLVVNPYAGAATEAAIELASTNGSVSITAVPEVITLTIGAGAANDLTGGGANARAEFDGHYIVIDHMGDSGTKHVIWLDVQGSRTPAAGGKIKDGELEVADLSAITTVTSDIDCLDISGAANTSALATLIEGQIDTFLGAPGAAATTDHTITVTQQAGGAGTQTQVTNVTTLASFAHSGAASTLVVPTASTKGVTADPGAVSSYVFTMKGYVPADGASILIVGANGVESVKLEFKSGSTGAHASHTTTNAHYYVNTATVTTTNSVTGTLTGLIESVYDTAVATLATPANFNPAGASFTGTDNGSTTWTLAGGIPDGSASPAEVVPSVTLDLNTPAASMGRTHFLGCSMKVSDNKQDYLNSVTGTPVDILRGVIMFPSGVIPGLYDGSNIASADMPAAAHGTYASTKDQGDRRGDMVNGVFKFVLNGFTNTANYNAHITGSMDPTSPIYFPNVLNTDPTKIQERGHYLYAHYDVPAGLAIEEGSSNNVYLTPGEHDHNSADFVSSGNYRPTFEIWREKFTHASTPWIMSQTLGNAPKKLFKFYMLDAGSIGHGQVKISIANIQKSTDPKSAYGKFDVQIRKADDLDTAPIILQSFSGVNLNPSSDRYIARVIGDQNTFYEFEKNEGKQKLVTEGLYPNRSQYVRVEVVDQIESGAMEATALPIGFAGKNHLVLNGDALADDKVAGAITLKEPPLPYRQNVSIGQGNTKVVDPRFYWGLQIQNVTDVAERNRASGTTSLAHNLTKHFPTVGSFPAWVGDNRNAAQGTGSADLDADAYNHNYFSLEKVLVRCKSSNTANAVDPRFWHEAVYIRNGNTSFNNVAGTPYLSVENGVNSDKHKDAANGYRYLDVAKDFAQSASKRFYKFTVPMQGGFDGLDIFDKDKADMSNLAAFREMSSNTSSTLGGPDGPTTAAFRKAVDILAEKSDVDIQLLAIPGMRDAGITDYAIDKTEERFDALYVMDMPAYDHDLNLVTTTTQETSVTNTAQTLADRNLDTSFAATYFPDLVVQDGNTNVVAPPSVAVLGAMSLNDSVAHPWFAPAGFARGALASTIEASVYLNRPNMDVLYNADINPITSFPNSGESVVIFGQKTMLQAQSALDRVNVRRLLIDVRRKVRSVANTILFEPNRESTLARFSALVNPILGRIQQQQGLDRYKVVIDTTTTTQQDVENNTIRGKIFLQPTRSVEFISLDFVVTNAGAEI